MSIILSSFQYDTHNWPKLHHIYSDSIINSDDTNGNIPDNISTFEISNRDKKLGDGYTVKINVPKTACVISNEEEDISPRQNSHSNNPASNSAPRAFPTILKMVVGAAKRNLLSIDVNDEDEEDDSETNHLPKVPTMDDVLEKAKYRLGIHLDLKQTRAYEMICTTFMIKIINDRRAQFVGASNPEQTRKIDKVIKGLESIGGKTQLIMFLTGPAGAGKTTAIKMAQTFCEKFSEACHIPFDQYSFYFTAYTGAAASEFGGITTLTALQIPMYGDISEATESTQSILNRVKILIMDEISFMSVKHLQLISKRLQTLFDCTSPFGGFSVIFCGDFRQLEFESEGQLLYTTQSNMYFENLLNAALILENKHRFRDDPLYGKIMSDMWSQGLDSNQIKEINKRVVTDKRSLPDVFDDDCHYACPTNQHRNIISANNFRRHIWATHR